MTFPAPKVMPMPVATIPKKHSEVPLSKTIMGVIFARLHGHRLYHGSNDPLEQEKKKTVGRQVL